MSLILSQAVANTLIEAISAAIGASGYLRIYGGVRPANPDEEITDQVLLAECRFGDPAFGAVASGQISANTLVPEDAVLANGTATWARVLTSGEVAVLDGDVGTAGSGALIILNSVNLVAGGALTIESFALTMPTGEA